MNQYHVEYLLLENLGWSQAIVGDLVYDSVTVAAKLSVMDHCDYRVRVGEKIIARFKDGEVLQDDSGIYKVGGKIQFVPHSKK